MKKIKMMILSVGLVILLLSSAGCGADKTDVKSKVYLEVNKVTFLRYSGDSQKIEMYIFTPDCHVDKYLIDSKENNQSDLLSGKLPAKDEYNISQYEITEEAWNNLVIIIARENFMELEEELSHEEVYDAPSIYIQVESSDAVHKSGGYSAGEGENSDDRRFRIIVQAIDEIIDDFANN